MKFGALLRRSCEENSELQNLFDCYKQLKKRLKRLPGRSGKQSVADQAVHGSSIYEHERAFVATLILDIQAFNVVFEEREEQSVIRLSLLEEAATDAKSPEEIASVYKQFVDFHGQTLMLVHWSILAYTSVLKILKKHYKRTGLTVQVFNLQDLLSQPFCSVELISGLVRKAEETAQQLATRLNAGLAPPTLSACSPAGSPVAQLISAARASVAEIANSAAHGHEALDRHLREQPTSSDEASVGDAEDEVASAAPDREGGQLASPAPADAPAGAHSLPSSSQQRPLQPACALPAEALGDCEPAAKRRHIGNGNTPGTVLQGLWQHESRVDRQESLGDSSLPGHNASVLQPVVHGGSSHCASKHTKREGIHGGNGSCLGEEHAIAGDEQGREPLTVGHGFNAAGLEGSRTILRQTQMALGLWEQLHYTASTPSTVVPPTGTSKRARTSGSSVA